MTINGLDRIDNQIIDLLLKNARLTYSEIGEIVGLSRTAVKTRIASLEREGIIKGYKAMIDPESAPEMMTFVVNIETKPENYDECKNILAQAKETVTVVQTTGRCHLMAICLVADTKAMRQYVNNLYNNVPGILSINANAVLDVIKGSIIPEN